MFLVKYFHSIGDRRFVNYWKGSAQGIICDGRGDDRHGFSRLVSIVLLNLRGFIYRDRYHKLECLDVDFLFFSP